MATWTTPRRWSYGDNPLSSPLTPRSPRSLPRWLRTTRQNASPLSNGRVKMFLLAATCLALGWMATSMLGPNQDAIMDGDYVLHDDHSAEILHGDKDYHPTHLQPGIIGAHTLEEEEQQREDHLKALAHKEPSVSGALADLHHAVSDRLQSWRPKLARPRPKPLDLDKSSKTASAASTDEPGTSSNLTITEVVKEGLSDEDRLGARTRIGKCTIMFYGNGLWERCLRTHENHDREHGYRLHILRQQIMDDVWSKPAYILSLLLKELAKPPQERLEWLFWVDADTIILNPNVPFDVFLPPPGSEFDNVHLLYSNDWNGLNNGVFPVRVNQWAVNLFSAIVAFRQFKSDEVLTFRDQSAMNMMMKEPQFAKHILEVPQRWFNAYQGEHNDTLQPFQIRRGDLLVHFAGVPSREERMEHWLDRAERHLDDWEVPFKSTSYLEEAREFWREQSTNRKAYGEKLAAVRTQVSNVISITSQRVADYGERVPQSDKDAIAAQTAMLQRLLDDERTKDRIDILEQGMANFNVTATTLNMAVMQSLKDILKAAREALLVGERVLMEANFDDDLPTTEMQPVSEAVSKLKALIAMPDNSWAKQEMLDATNEMTLLTSRYEVQRQSQAAQEQEQAAKLAILQGAKQMAQLEAETAAAAAAAAANEGSPAGQPVLPATGTGLKPGVGDSGSGSGAGLIIGQPEEGVPPAGEPHIVVVTMPAPTVWTTVGQPAEVAATDVAAPEDISG